MDSCNFIFAAKARAYLRLLLPRFCKQLRIQKLDTVDSGKMINFSPRANQKVIFLILVMEFHKCLEDCEICNLEMTISKHWHKYLKDEFKKPYFDKIYRALHTNEMILPPIKKIFAFSRFFKVKETRVVILAYEPSYNQNESNGLAYSANSNVDIPSTTGNLYKEVFRSFENTLENFDLNTLDKRKPESFVRVYSCHIQTIRRNLESAYGIKLTGDLSVWARQGVLLLNTHLTVLKNKRLSHSKIGWNFFTDKVIELVSKECENVVFLLWGTFAHKKERLIDKNKHCILKSGFPHVYCYNKGFYGNNHFVLANEYLQKHGKGEIDWTHTRNFKE